VPGTARHPGRDCVGEPERLRRLLFHKHFKTITATTPLQYPKELRLLEARRLLQMGRATVTTAATEVVDERSSQFSREHARKLAVPRARIWQT